MLGVAELGSLGYAAKGDQRWLPHNTRQVSKSEDTVTTVGHYPDCSMSQVPVVQFVTFSLPVMAGVFSST